MGESKAGVALLAAIGVVVGNKAVVRAGEAVCGVAVRVAGALGAGLCAVAGFVGIAFCAFASEDVEAETISALQAEWCRGAIDNDHVAIGNSLAFTGAVAVLIGRAFGACAIGVESVARIALHAERLGGVVLGNGAVGKRDAWRRAVAVLVACALGACACGAVACLALVAQRQGRGVAGNDAVGDLNALEAIAVLVCFTFSACENIVVTVAVAGR